MKEIRCYRANEFLHCDLEKAKESRSKSLIFNLIQGYGGMHHWVKYCVNWCMKSEVIALMSFVRDSRTDGRTPSISMYPPMDSFHHGIQCYVGMHWSNCV